MFTIYIKKSAKKVFLKLGKRNRKYIKRKLTELSKSNRPEALGVLLVGIKPNTFRIRAGNYRILYRVDLIRKSITIYKIGHRKNVYFNFNSF